MKYPLPKFWLYVSEALKIQGMAAARISDINSLALGGMFDKKAQRAWRKHYKELMGGQEGRNRHSGAERTAPEGVRPDDR